MINRVDFSLIPFPPTQWTGDIFQFAQLLAEHLQGNLDNSVFSGQFNGAEPQTDIGLWFNQDAWMRWDTEIGKYIPLKLQAGLVNNGQLRKAVLVASNTTADVVLNLPDKSGTIALTEDALAPQETDTQATNAIVIDWESAKVYAVISGNCSVNDSGGGADGKGVELFVETPVNHSVALTITFPANWRVTGATLTANDSSHRSVDKFWIERIGNDTFVSKVASFIIDQGGSGGDTIKPAFDSADINAGTSTLKVHFTELIAGTTTPDKWIVRKNGNRQGIDSISITNRNVVIRLSNVVGANSVMTVQYLATDQVKDLAGNFANPFGPSDVDVIG